MWMCGGRRPEDAGTGPSIRNRPERSVRTLPRPRGRVLRAGDCAAVSRALVVFWQAGPNGYVYRPRGRGSVLTDRSGRFRIEGPVPASSGLRPPHIHMAVIHPDYEELLTRYVVRRGAKSGRMRIVLTPLL